jgi:phosphoribosylformimino-5-aminoimidazole carboxamide ribotide isomerase
VTDFMTMSFEIIPAIDLLDGHVVRLEQGRRDKRTIYSKDPVGFVKKFESAGARRLHVVDLNGAFEGQYGNLELVRQITTSTKMTVELGGGVRSHEAAEEALAAGVHEVILGTRAVEDTAFVQSILKSHGQQVIVGIDARDGMVATRGWIQSSQLDAVSFALTLQELGCRRVIYTDIATDGMLGGPNLEALRTLATAAPDLEVVASGGVATIEDLLAIRALGLRNIVGAITGKALYDGRLDLASAVQRLAQAG